MKSQPARDHSHLRVGLHVGQLTQAVPGGIGRVTDTLCRALPDHLELVAFAATGRKRAHRLAARFDPRVELHRLRAPSPSWQYALWHRTRRPRVPLDVDVCHAPSLAIPPTRAPLVVTINDLAFRDHPETFTPHGVRFHERGLDLARREAAAVITPSSHVHDALRSAGFPHDRLHLVPLGLPAVAARPAPETRAAVASLGVAGPYVLVAGTVEPRKRHRVLAAAIQRVRETQPDVTLVVAGPPGWLPAQAVDPLDRPGVLRLGAVSDRDLDALYRHASVVTSVSVAEGFGLTVLEAMARGRPVVASDIPPHVELVGRGPEAGGLLVAPDDVDGTAATISALLADPTRAAVLGRRARARAAAFDVAATIAGHVAVYCAVSDSPCGCAPAQPGPRTPR